MTLEQNEMLIVAAAAGGTMVIVFIGIVILIVRNGSRKASEIVVEEREARLRKKRRELAEKDGRAFDEICSGGSSSNPLSTNESNSVTPQSGELGAGSTHIHIEKPTPSNRQGSISNPVFERSVVPPNNGQHPQVLSPANFGAGGGTSPISPELEKYSQSSSVNRDAEGGGTGPLGSVHSPSIKSTEGADVAKDMQVESFNSIEHSGGY